MSDDLRNWALALVALLALSGSYYEALRVRDEDAARAARLTRDAAHRVCESTRHGRTDLNRRSQALADYINAVLALNQKAQKLQPTPAVLRPLERREVADLKQLRDAQKPLPLIRCP